LLLSRKSAKFSTARRKVKIAAGIAKAILRTNFGLTTPQVKIAATCSRNEFLEVPLILRNAWRDLEHFNIFCWHLGCREDKAGLPPRLATRVAEAGKEDCTVILKYREQI